MGRLLAICRSEKKGTQKQEIDEVMLIEDYGMEGDAHAGKWHRQISMLAFEKIEDFNHLGAQVDFGAFGENLVIEGFELSTLPIGTRFGCGDVILELTQVGKECHHHCQIFHKMGDCIMPREGIFCKVIQGGMIKVGLEVSILAS